jgi:hypothetical protein
MIVMMMMGVEQTAEYLEGETYYTLEP